MTKADITLHNSLMHKSTRDMYCPSDYVDQETSQGLFPRSWCNEATEIQGLINLRAQGSNNLAAKRRAKWFQRLLQHGKLSWQREIDWSKQYLYQYLCFVPHDIRWFVLSMVMNNIKVIIPTGYRT